MARFQPGHYLGYQAIADGSLGKLVTGEFTYKCFRPQEYYTGTRGTWAVDGGGVMLLQAIHSLDVMLWYMGDVERSWRGWGTLTHQMESEDTALAIVTFTSGAMATLVGTTTFHDDRPGGPVRRRLDDADRGGRRPRQPDPARTARSRCGSRWRPSAAAAEPPVLNTFQDLARWVRDDAYSSPTLVKAADSRKAIELIHAIYESARTGATVTLSEKMSAG